MNMKFFCFLALAGFIGTSCSKTVTGPPATLQETVMVKAGLSGYEGQGQALPGETEIKDMQACIFDGGEMVQVFEGLTPSGNTFDLQVNRRSGTLYLIANTAGLIDLKALQEEDITEDEWLKKSIGLKDNAPVHFFSGSISLDDTPGPELPVSLRRGIARFDLQIRTAGNAAIDKMTLKNAAGSAYILPVKGNSSPDDAARGDVSVTFDTPVTSDAKAVMYAYEQENIGLEIAIEGTIDGKPVTLSKAIDGNLDRNKIYTVTVRKDNIDISLEITLDEWETGGDTELVPASRYSWK